MKTGSTVLVLALAWGLGCSASTHPSEPADLGRVASSEDLFRLIPEPGPIRFERIVAADWEVDRRGLVNLDHPRAREAGLKPGKEPIQLYFYALEHPEHGLFLVDSGAESGFLDASGSERVGFLLNLGMNLEALNVRTTTADWLRQRAAEVRGVFLTHLHLDHVMGLPDLPKGAAVYVGRGEAGGSTLMNLFMRGSVDRMLEGLGPLRELQFMPDEEGLFAGVLDVFGDGSLFAIHVPGHTPGSTAFVARTTEGAKLLVGDACHTRWGWENDVEPGAFSSDQPVSALSLEDLRELSKRFPGMEVHLGHQSLEAVDRAGKPGA